MLHHVRRGSGPPLLLVHGIGMSHRAWDEVTPALEDAFECVAVDLPGFGASPRLDGPATMRALADACAATMRAAGHERFHVAGNSLGGGVALHLALDGRALSACGLSPVGFMAGWDALYLHLSLSLSRATAPVNQRAFPVIARPGPVRRALLTQYVAHGERLPVERIAESFGELAGATGFADTKRHAINWKCPSVPGELPCPVTVAWGGEDRLLLHGPQAARARERLPRARHRTLVDVGHLPTWDDPGGTAEVVRAAAGG